MRLYMKVLGSGSIVPTRQRFCSSIYLRGASQELLLDIGPGTIQKMVRYGLDPHSISGVLISHYHVDHVAELLPLIKMWAYDRDGRPARSQRGLVIIGPKGLRELVRSLIDGSRYFGYLDSTMNYKKYTSLVEVSGDEAIELGDVRVKAVGVRHYDGVAYRLTFPGRSLAYSGDTVVDEGMIKLAEGVDVLIHECSFPSGSSVGLHTDDEGLSLVVERVRPKLLVVTHLYPAWEGREVSLASKILERHRCRVVIASDGLTIRF
ncbi:MAG: ribonuclease Z [Aigarchaeota archaeon]|nr:ribonuclease Z [Aigarchaeota archaeon]MDW8092219.1 ribonuclease Z [Nitrososphaerota archaeon]